LHAVKTAKGQMHWRMLRTACTKNAIEHQKSPPKLKYTYFKVVVKTTQTDNLRRISKTNFSMHKICEENPTRSSATAQTGGSDRYAVQSHLKSLMLVPIVCDCLLVNHTKVHSISHRLPVIAQYRFCYRLLQGCISLVHFFSVTSANIAINQNIAEN